MEAQRRTAQLQPLMARITIRSEFQQYIAHYLDRYIKLKYAQTGAVLRRDCHVPIVTLGESYMCDFAPPLLPIIRHKAPSFRRLSIPPCVQQ